MKLNIATLAVLVIGGTLFVFWAGIQGWTPLHVGGAFITALGFVLLVIARLQLGNAFSVRPKASTLVTTGLYSRIRNPIYVSAGLMILGVIMFARKPWWLLVFAVMIPVQTYRSHKESQVLEERFGEAYRAYKEQTWF